MCINSKGGGGYSEDDAEGAVKGSQLAKRTSVMLNQSSGGVGAESSSRSE